MKKNLKVIQFLLFLLSNRALVPFFRNRVLNQSMRKKDKSILETMSFIHRYIEYGDSVFYSAFFFWESKEGHDYWIKLSDKWVATN